jgi:hypothetical protein
MMSMFLLDVWMAGQRDGESLMAMGRDTRKEEKKNRPNINGEFE